MKRFSFRLESLRSLRVQAEEQAQVHLARELVVEAAARDKLVGAASRLSVARAVERGASGGQLAARQAYIERCEQDVNAAAAGLARQQQVVEQAREALAEAGYEAVDVRVGDGSLGVPEKAPFEAIAVAAAAPTIPERLYEQLADGGRLVLPKGSRWGQDLVQVVKTPDGPAERESVPCRFVPLLGEQGFDGRA